MHRDPLEVLHNVGDVGIVAVDPGRLKRLVENASRWAYERGALAIFRVARLLTDQHDAGVPFALPKDGLRGMAKQRAALTSAGCVPQRLQRRTPGQIRDCAGPGLARYDEIASDLCGLARVGSA